MATLQPWRMKPRAMARPIPGIVSERQRKGKNGEENA